MSKRHSFVTIQDTDMYVTSIKLQEMYFSDSLVRISRIWLICIKLPDYLLWIYILLFVGKLTFSSFQNCFHIEIRTTGCQDN